MVFIMAAGSVMGLAIANPANQFAKLVITAAGQTFGLGDYDKTCPLISSYCPRLILEMK